MLLDSNLIIYASKSEYDDLRNWMSQHPICVSALSQLEVLGYHRLTPEDRNFFVDFFSALPVLPITSEVIDQAIALRQQRKMSLGDPRSLPPHWSKISRSRPIILQIFDGFLI